MRSTISPNERLQRLYHPWTSYAIVPLFALANAGVAIDGGALARARSRRPVTLGILLGYVVGKPRRHPRLHLARESTHRRTPAAARGMGGSCRRRHHRGIGFTVALLVASLAFDGRELEEAKIGILAAALLATALTWLLFRATALLPRGLRSRALAGGAEPLTDLYLDVDDERDHIRGSADAPVTIVEYGDFQCPYCGRAEPVVRELLADFGDLRYVWRHLPLNDVHRHAQLAAEASEAAADQGAFWEMHDLLLAHQDALRRRPGRLRRAARARRRAVPRSCGISSRPAAIAEDVDSADLSGVSGTPTFFVNGRRHHGAYDIATLRLRSRRLGSDPPSLRPGRLGSAEDRGRSAGDGA